MALSRTVIACLLLGQLAACGSAAAVSGDTGVHLTASSGLVRLELSPRTAHPNEKLRIVVINDSPHTVLWGGCFAWQRLTDGRWQPGNQTQCLALAFLAAHSRRDEASTPDSYGPGRYRASFIYDFTAAHRFGLVAHAYLTVVPAARSARAP